MQLPPHSKLNIQRTAIAGWIEMWRHFVSAHLLRRNMAKSGVVIFEFAVVFGSPTLKLRKPQDQLSF